MRKKCFLYSLTLLSFWCNAQNNEKVFFDQQLTEYKHWLDSNHISANLKINTFSYTKEGDTLVIRLKTDYQSVDSLPVVWRKLDSLFISDRRLSLADYLHQQGAFLFDFRPELLKIYILGSSDIRYRELSYTTSIKDKNLVTLGGNPITIKLEELRLPASYKKIPLSGKPLVKAVSRSLAIQLDKYYRNKPASWFYSVKVDTTRSSYNKLIYRVSCLKNEIINENYFEFIEITLDIAQQANSSIEVRLGLKGKYCGGLHCPEQREKFYYSMDSKYEGKLTDYTNFLERKIDQWLSN